MAQYGNYYNNGTNNKINDGYDYDEEDLYEGFNYTIDLAPPQTGNRNLQSGYGNAPGTGYKPLQSQMNGRQQLQTGRLMTGQRNGTDARPMTSVSGAGFTSNPKTPGGGPRMFDPLGEIKKGPAPALIEKSENSPEDKAREMEKIVHSLLEKSAEMTVKQEYLTALDLAKDAGKKERLLCKHRESNNLQDQINHELTYSVCFNLAHLYHLNEMYNEAITTYELIVKNKQYTQAGRLRANMGNIFYEQEKYPKAIKMYRMALDQIPNTSKEIRFKIMRNIGNSFVKMGQFQDAIQSYEEIMDERNGIPDHQTGYNLVICYYALGDIEKIRKGFTNLLNIKIEGITGNPEDDDELQINNAINNSIKNNSNKNNTNNLLPESPNSKSLSNYSFLDELKAEMKEREKKANEYMIIVARLCAPMIDRKNWISGYDWIIDTLKMTHENLASEMEICKSMHYLKEKQFDKSIEVLKSFEKKDHEHKAMASTNLSFLYFIEGDYIQADKYANLAVRYQRYNAKALVNKGNCLLIKDEFEKAKEMYLEAIGVEADCIEAIYNLGLVNKRMGIFTEALQAFEKLHSIIPSNIEVLYQIGILYEINGNYPLANKWFNVLLTCFGNKKNKKITDPAILTKLGQLYNKENDEGQAFHYHLESYRYFPVNLDVISWLGVWHVKNENYDRAIHFFERASQIQPNEVKWKLMITSCHRRMGSYEYAIVLYEKIHQEYPENIECLRYLVAICKDLGHRYEQYQKQLLKLENDNNNNNNGSNGSDIHSNQSSPKQNHLNQRSSLNELNTIQSDQLTESISNSIHSKYNNINEENEQIKDTKKSRKKDLNESNAQDEDYHHLNNTNNTNNNVYSKAPSFDINNHNNNNIKSNDNKNNGKKNTNTQDDQTIDDWGDADVGDLLAD